MDVFKPYPARQLESLPGGWGIMADDVMAGVYANLLLRAGLRALACVACRAEILAVGSELLTPLRPDTNALVPHRAAARDGHRRRWRA